jgi:hypothetical protein
VRCTDDQVEGRIVWANGVSVKIQWNDGEQVTWRRDSLAGRPVEILAGDEGQPAATESAAESTATPVPETPPVVQEVASELPVVQEVQEEAPEPPVVQIPTAETTTPEIATDVAPASQEPQGGMPVPDVVPPAAEAPAPVKEPHKARATKPASAATPSKLSALDAAAKVLAETGQPLTTQDMIKAMAEKGYWSSPGGKTPAATLYSAILRELATKGDAARFVKTDRGKFASRVGSAGQAAEPTPTVAEAPTTNTVATLILDGTTGPNAPAELPLS